MFYGNPAATRSSYPADLQAVMSIAKADESRVWISFQEGVKPGSNPLYVLHGLAARLGLGQVMLKDESARSELGSFKALGAPIALVRLILRHQEGRKLDPAGLFAGL